MVPRPRLICQKPGLRPIGRSSGVPDKSSRGLSYGSPYSAQILICFVLFLAYIFPCLKSSMGWVGALQLWNGSVAFNYCHSDQKEAAAKDNAISQHPSLVGQALRFHRDDHTGRTVIELAKLTDQLDKTHNNVKIIKSGIKWRGSLFVYASTFTAFHSISTPDASSLSATRTQQNDLKFDSCQLSNLSLKVFYKQFSLLMVRHEDGVLILCQNYIFHGHSAVNCSKYFFNCQVASHMTEPYLLLPTF